MVPPGGEEIGAQRGVDRATDHEAEVARPTGGHESGRGRPLQLVHDRAGVDRVVRQGAFEHGPEVVEVDHRMDPRVAKAAAILGDRVGRAADQIPSCFVRR